MTITYSVSAQVLDVLKYQADRWKHPDPEEAREIAHLSKADPKTEQEVAQTYHEYIERFRRWVSDYATGAPKIPK